MAKEKQELEKQNKQLRESQICEKCGGGGQNGVEAGPGKKAMGNEGLPQAPEKYTLTGHREKITKLQIHPTFTLVATASQDGSIKLWDYEQGENEQTLRSHTG